MESHFEWPCAVELRCAPHGPRLESNFERKLILGPYFVLNSRAALRASQPRFGELHSEWKVISNGPCAVDLRCAPHGPRLESNFERKLILGPCFVLDSRAALRASQLPLSALVKCIPNGKSFRMALRNRSALRASRTPFGK